MSASCQRLLQAFFLCISLALPLAASAADEAPPLREIRVPETALVRDPALPAWARPLALPANKPEEAMYIRLSDSQLHLGDDTRYLIRRVTAANSAATLRDIGQHEIIFQPDYQQVRLHAVRILRGDEVIDELQSVKIRFVQRERDAEHGVFTGWVTALIVVDDLRVGDSLDVQYSLIGQNPVFGKFFFDGGGLDFGAASGVRRFSVDADAHRSLNFRVIGQRPEQDVVAPEVRTDQGRKLTTYLVHDRKSVDVEPYAPPDFNALRWIQVSQFSSWKEVVDWARDLFKTGPLPADFAPLLNELRAIHDPEAQVMRALSFVQNDIRYVSMALGENSHRPFSPHEVFVRRFGDCKDKSLLLVSLLRELGMEAYPVLVSTDNRRSLDTLLPSPLDFDHAIVKLVLNGHAWFLDPTLTDQTGSLAVLGDAHPDTQVLVVKPGNTALERTPPVRTELVTVVRSEHFTLTAMDQPALLDITTRYAGLNAEASRSGIKTTSPEQLRKYYAGYLDRRYSQAELLGAPEIKDDPIANTITLTLHYRIRGFAEKDQADWNMRYVASNLTEQFYLPNTGRRTAPLQLPSYPFIGHYSAIITLPDNYDAKRRPLDKVIEGDGYRIEQHLSLTGHEARAEIEMRILSDRVRAENVPAFLNDIRLSNSMLSSGFSVDSGDIKTETKPEVPFKQAIREHYESVLTKTSSQIEQAARAGRGAGDALCERALANAYLGHQDEARRDATSAMHDLPDAPRPLYCLAITQMFDGKLDAAYSSLSRAIALGDDSFDTLARRALAAYYQGKYKLAADDFQRALDGATTDTLRARARYWLALIQRQQKQAISAPENDGVWPTSGIALLAGKLSPEALLLDIHTHTSGEVLDVELGEAYLFVGQSLLLQGDRLRALAYLQQAQDKGIVFSLSHLAAVLEARR